MVGGIMVLWGFQTECVWLSKGNMKGSCGRVGIVHYFNFSGECIECIGEGEHTQVTKLYRT